MEHNHNQSDHLIQEQKELDRSNEQELNEGDIEHAAQYYKRYFAQQTAEKVKGQEEHQHNQEMIGFSLNQSHASEHGETPQFGIRIDPQHQQQPEINRQPNASQSIQNNTFEEDNRNHSIQVKQIPEDTEKQSKRVKLFPLYGIDHSKQFFQACPDLSIRLKKYKDFVKCYSSGEITSKSFIQGCSLNNQLTLNGPEVKELGKAVFRNVFRRMQQYINNICKKNIVKISEEDVLQLTQLLLDETNLEEDNLEILKKFMKLSLDIPAQITQNEVFQLYSFLMRWLNQNNTSDVFQFGFSEDDKKPRFVWTREKQIKFCQEYQAKKSLSLVVEAMNAENMQPKVTILGLKYKLEQLIKSTIKKIQNQYKKYEKKQCWIPLMQRDLKVIARDPKALSLRLLLLKSNIKKYVFLQDIKKITIEIESFYKDKNKHNQKNKLILANTKRITSDSQSIDNQDENQKSLSSLESEEYLTPSKNNQQKANYIENRSGPKYYQQTLMNTYQKNHQKSKNQNKVVPSSSSFKKGVSQFQKFSSKFKSGPKQK